MENWTLFVSETYPNSGQKPPEIETLAEKPVPAGIRIPVTAGRATGREMKPVAVPFEWHRPRAQPPPQSLESKRNSRRVLGFRRCLSSAAKRPARPLGIDAGGKTLPTAGGAPLRRRLCRRRRQLEVLPYLSGFASPYSGHHRAGNYHQSIEDLEPFKTQ